MIGLRRAFSTYSRVQGTSIALSSQQPPKLRIPLESGAIDVTLHESESVADFESKVKASCPQLSKFKISSDKDTLGEVMKAKFTL